MLTLSLKYSALTALAVTCLAAHATDRVQTFPLRDTTGLIAPKVKTEAVNYLGRKSVRITMEGDDHEGLAILPGTDFQDGVIEADIALKTTAPPASVTPASSASHSASAPTHPTTNSSTCAPETQSQPIRPCATTQPNTSPHPISVGIVSAASGLGSTSLTQTSPSRLGPKSESK